MSENPSPDAAPGTFTGSIRIYNVNPRTRLYIVGKPVDWDRESDVVVPLRLISAMVRRPQRRGTMTVLYTLRPEGRLATEIVAYDASTERPDFPDEIADDSRLTHAGGTLKWFNAELGYGFLETPAGDCILHASVLDRCGVYTVRTGDKLYVGMVTTKKGWYAVSVEVAP
jgi:cold shock CspA family protein